MDGARASSNAHLADALPVDAQVGPGEPETLTTTYEDSTMHLSSSTPNRRYHQPGKDARMNHRERYLAVLEGRPPDRVPFAPRLLLWYNARLATGTMPAEYEGLSLRELEHKLGVGTPARDGKVFNMRREGVEVVTRKQEGRLIEEQHTPVGTIRSVTHYSDDLSALDMGGRHEEWLLKTPEDYRVWEWIWEHTYWDAAYDEYETYDAEIGTDGLPMVGVGDAPFHEFLLQGGGYINGYYHLADYPRALEHLLAVMTEVQRDRMWPVLAKSPARLLLHGVHHSSAFTPPPIYEKYILPYYREFMPLMHENGKAVAMHADNDTSLILELLEEAGYDMLECFVTSPMVPLTLEQARKTLGHRVTLYGCLPSLLFAPSFPEDDFRAYVDRVFDIIAPGDAIILGVADNVMPDSVIDRVAYVQGVVEERGRYPVH
jgi:uroporphyrinogen-III decarboxylase